MMLQFCLRSLAAGALGLTACVGAPAGWNMPGAVHAPGYYGAPAAYGSPAAYSGYAPGVGYRHYDGRAHYYHARCRSCRYHPCRCGHRFSGHSYHSRDHHGEHDDRIDPGQRKYRILSGDLEGKKKPDNFHTLDWYHQRGYSLRDLKIETESGKVIDRRPSSRSKSGKKKK